jgi:hypothetical protein
LPLVSLVRSDLGTVRETDLLGHPAGVAWRRLAPGAPEPRHVFVLKPEKKRSAVYRLEGAGAGGSAVIAKRGRAARVATELLIYTDVLPHVPAVTLRCYGSIEDQEPGFSWLFLEDAGEQRFSSGNPEHRALAAHWLALLHMSIPSRPEWQAYLSCRDVEYYRTIVGLARDAVAQSRPNRAFATSDVPTLEAILMYCDRLQSRWSSVEAICDALPYTLVHGDFGAKNVRVRADPEGLQLLPLDWDSAGWGVAAADLSQTDVPSYWSVARARWPELEPNALARLTTVGRMFLALESITGEVDALASEWVSDVMRKMRAYESELSGALKAAGWASW